MPPAPPAQPGNNPAGSVTPLPGVDAALHLSARTVAWLADHPRAYRFVRSVGDTLTELERSGQDPGVIDALRRILACHQPTSAGRCRACARVTGRRRRFPCIVWHEIRLGLLGSFAATAALRPAGDRCAVPSAILPSWSSPARPELICTTTAVG
ncbi:MAG: hypothetical protein ACRDRP_14340 [Pseudonocardiaceae bacterium]